MFRWRAVLATVAIAGGFLPVTSVGASDDQADSAEEQLDVLRATDAELKSRIAELDTQRSETASALEGAENAATEASRQAAVAEGAEDRARSAADEADDEVRRVAVSAYVGVTDLDGLAIFGATDPAEANRLTVYLRAETERRQKVFDRQSRAHARLERASEASTEAAAAFDAAVDDRQTLLAELDATRETQVQFASEVEVRIEYKLAEAEALAEIDAEQAAAVAAEAQSLSDAANAATSGGVVPKSPPPVVQPGPVPPPPPTATTPPQVSPAPAPAPRSPAPTSPPTTAPPVASVSTTKVGPFVVATSISSNVQGLLDASKAAGLTLGGSGYRDTQRQIELRMAHCGTSSYDVWEKPSSQCSPPTARPGRSMHEKGLALDITCSGALIRSRSSPCFVWLAANAATYGLYNLPSEPWHWSVNGN